MTADLLQAIVAATTTRVSVRRAAVPAISLEARTIVQSAPRGFRNALAAPGVQVIAECKRRSPSRGVLREDYVPASIAASYERGGAAAISVLTEPTFFDGDLAHLEAVRTAVSVPVLRKDFIVDEYQLVEARASGADAVLLIVAALSDADMRRLMRSAEALRLDVLVEVHDERELDRALEAGATLVGVNNRNLRTLEVDVDASFRLAARLPRGVLAVAESGLRTRADLDRLAQAGYKGFLIGERLMTTPDPGATLAALLSRGAAA
jgi:indole-3-glycerol phosphate synthase